MANDGGGAGGDKGESVRLLVEVPLPLLGAMRHFLLRHPNWDQGRLLQVALAGFLVQNGSQDRAVTRCYLANLFPSHGGFRAGEAPSPRQCPLSHPTREAA